MAIISVRNRKLDTAVSGVVGLEVVADHLLPLFWAAFFYPPDENTKLLLIFPQGGILLMVKVFVSGCFDVLHSGHIRFFEEAAQYGDLYVSIGSDKTVTELKHRSTLYNEQERLYMVSALKYVKLAFIAQGSGKLDFLYELKKIKPDIFFVNADGDSSEKRNAVEALGIRYVVSNRIPKNSLPIRSTTAIRQTLCK